MNATTMAQSRPGSRPWLLHVTDQADVLDPLVVQQVAETAKHRARERPSGSVYTVLRPSFVDDQVATASRDDGRRSCPRPRASHRTTASERRTPRAARARGPGPAGRRGRARTAGGRRLALPKIVPDLSVSLGDEQVAGRLTVLFPGASQLARVPGPSSTSSEKWRSSTMVSARRGTVPNRKNPAATSRMTGHETMVTRDDRQVAQHQHQLRRHDLLEHPVHRAAEDQGDERQDEDREAEAP